MASGLEGTAQLAKQLESLGKALSVPIMRAAVRAGVAPVVAKAQQLIPVGTKPHKTYKGRIVQGGFAKSSIAIVTKSTNGGTTVSAAVGVRKEAFYALQFVERGTRKMRAQAWLNPAFLSTQVQQQTALADKLRAAIEAVANK